MYALAKFQPPMPKSFPSKQQQQKDQIMQQE